VRVRTLGGRSFEVFASVDWTLERLRASVERASGIPAREQRLVAGTLELDFDSYHDALLGHFDPFLRDQVDLTLVRRPEDVVSWLCHVESDPRALGGAPERIRSSREVVRRAMRVDPACLRFAAMELLADPDLMLEALAIHGDTIDFVDLSLWSSHGFVLQAVSINGLLLPRAARALREDPAIVLRAARTSGAVVLEHAPPQLWADLGFVSQAVGISGQALRFATGELQADPDIAFRAGCQDVAALEHAAPELWADRDFVRRAVRLTPCVLAWLPEELRSDDDFLAEVSELNSVGWISALAFPVHRDAFGDSTMVAGHGADPFEEMHYDCEPL